jgi:hypothetical protein
MGSIGEDSSMSAYIVYYEDTAKIVYKGKPREENFPGSKFAEGPFKSKQDAIARLRWMGRA